MTKGIHWLGHDTFKFEGETIIYTDPYNIRGKDKADIILITHEHYDHCSEEDIEKLRLKNAVLKSTRDVKEDQQVDAQVTINYANYFMEHLEDLLLGGPNPLQKAALFGLLFDETPTYQELINGTPKLACLFKLNDDYKASKTIDVTRLGFEPRTNSLKGYCSTVELPGHE